MKKQNKFALSILTVSLLSATSAMAAGNDSPFSIPLYLTNPAGMSETRIVKETTPDKKSAYIPDCPVVTKTKPNIVLYIDDSSSMNANLGGSSNTKIQMLRNVIGKVMENYGNDVTWSVSFMNQSRRDLALGATGQDVKNTIDGYSIPINQGTPLLNGYTRAVDKLANVDTNNKYVVVLTDGAANVGTNKDINDWLQTSAVGKSLDITYDLDGYGVADFAALNRDKNPARSNSIIARSNGFYNDWQYKLCSGDDMDICPSEVDKLDAKYLRQLSEPLEQKANIVTFTMAFGLSGANYPYYTQEDNRTRYMLEKGASGGGYYNGLKTYHTADNETELLNAFEQIIGSVVKRHDGDVTSTSKLGSPQYGNTPDSGSSITSVVKVDQHALAPVARPNGDKLYAQEFAALWLPIQEEKGLRSAELRFYETEYNFANGDTDNGIVTGVSTSDYTTPLFPNNHKAYATDKDFDYRKSAAKQMFAREFYKSNEYFDLTANNSNDSDEWQNALMPWISRKDGYGNPISDKDIIATAKAQGYRENVEEYRERSKYQMGDILESDIVTLGDFTDKDPATGYNGRKEFITAAANDGVAYIFQSNSAAAKKENAQNPYTLKMTYSPTALLREKNETVAHRYKDIANKQYALDTSHPHVYMLSGGIVAHTLEEPFRIDYVIGNAGRGARGLYGLNLTAISKEQGFDNPQKVPLFEAGAHRGGEESGMGYTIGYPSTARFGKNVVKPNGTERPDLALDKDIHIMTAVGSGFSTKTDLDKQETTMYLYDTLGGADVGIEGDKANSMANIGLRNTVGALANNGKKIVVNSTNTNTGGLATPNLLDVNMDGVVDYAFAGDYSGNMYRCDVRNYENVTCSMIFKGDPKRPITSAPIAVQLGWEYVIIWGTGSDLFEEDLKDTNTQAIYGIYQQFDPKTLDITKEYDKVATNLLQQKFEPAFDYNGKQFRNVALNKDKQPMGEHQPGKGLFYDGKQYDGWVIDLEHGGVGERIVTQPIVSARTVYFASRVYKTTASSHTFKPWDNSWTKADWEKPSTGWTTIDQTQPKSAGLCSDKESDKLNGGGGWAKDWTKVQDDTGLPKLDVGCFWKEKTCDDKQTVEYTVTADDKPGSVELSSSLIQLKAENGGRIYPKKDITSYVIMDYDEGSSNAYGYQGDGSVVATESYPSLITISHNNPHAKNSNRDNSGNQGNQGVYPRVGYFGRPDTHYEQKDNHCIPDDGKMSSQLDITTPKGFDAKLKKDHFLTVNCLRRISWREIY